ncbi:MAG TPA: 23S rRNA (guanosine(2251)-2'-O)-methyltransferase RlmB [Chloroflexi bacterium]|nr:23S rRNA (guanosine(2251)-2'-O)-methyltransferase RlmB [Chloroflexota bacterium]
MSELLYGRHAVHEALRAGRRRIYRLWVEGKQDDAPLPKEGPVAAIAALALSARIATRTIRGGLFDRLRSEHVNAQGVALEVDEYPYVEVESCLATARKVGEPPLLLILDHLQDPQNLGTLIRTAEAMGVHGVLIPDRRAARVTPAVSNASAGAVEHLAVAQVVNINRTIDELKQRNVWVAGLDSDPQTPPLARARLDGGLAVVVGSEGEGLSRLTREKCDFLVRLPMFGRVDSLNAAVAGSIVLYAARQARMVNSQVEL